jgi:hypothetical protein
MAAKCFNPLATKMILRVPIDTSRIRAENTSSGRIKYTKTALSLINVTWTFL